MNSLDIHYLESLTFESEQLSTLRRVGEYLGKQELFFQQTPEILETLRLVTLVESTDCSNRIEGVTAPRARVEALVRQTTTPRNRSEQEIAGYRDALALIHESARDMEFSTNLILQLHRWICRYLPEPGGRWKMEDNQIVERNPDGSMRRVLFKPVGPLQTPQAMNALVEQYREAIQNRHQEPLVVIALTILDFLCIHPFRDGNGRVARLLTLLLLYQFDCQVGRYISLERIYEESKETYYETLGKSSQGWHEGKHDVFPWMNYFWGVLLRAYEEFEERVGTLRAGRVSKTELIKMAVNRKIEPFAISEIEADCPGISRDMIRVVLRQLRDEEIIVLQGKGRGAKWIRKMG